MAPRRTVLSLAALVVALIAGIASFSYLRGVQNRAYHNATLVTVYTISAPVARGTSGTAVIAGKLVKRGEIPQQYMPADAVTDLASIRNGVAAADLMPGQILESNLFVSPTATVSASEGSKAIPKGDIAITVSVDSVHGVAGLIQPGDNVDILVETAPGVEQFLYQNVAVMAVGSVLAPTGVTTAQSTTPTTAPSSSSSSNLITLAVPPDAAARLALAQSGGGGVMGSLYLALVPPGNAASHQAPISQSNLIPATVTPS